LTVLRTALRPRWLALLVVVLVAATGMALLGQWQLNRARERSRGPAEQAERAREQAVPRPLQEVLAPRQTFPREGVNTRVSATGSWEPTRRLLVSGRELNGRKGFWVLVPLRLADGSAVPVIRGWVPSATDPAAVPPVGDGVQVVGLLQPSEPPSQRAPGQTSGLPADQVERVAAVELVKRWPYPLITGFVVQQTETPTTGPVPAPVPPPSTEAGLDLQNLSYAVQWWIFAGLGLFFWWRLVRDDHRGDLDDGLDEDPHPEAPHPDAPHPEDPHATQSPVQAPVDGVTLDPAAPDDVSSLSDVVDGQSKPR
jgi:cytochrome oxidase assembly protein ShyY1